MSKPRLLDLFCGAGGAAMGYHRAGFEVVGVDIEPQPNNPHTFIQADAIEYLAAHGHEYDAIHASPPCQHYSSTRNLHNVEYPDLIDKLREVLEFMGVFYVIENVPGAPLIAPHQLCGSMFGLRVRRHRLFEVVFPADFMWPQCNHAEQGPIVTVAGGGPNPASFNRPSGGGPHRKPKDIADAKDAMGIDWPMTRAEINEAIPPAYTQWIGERMLEWPVQFWSAVAL